MKKEVIVILGQTAVGKTSTSIKLAKKINGEIINGDALQVYKGLDILTAKIKEEEKDGVPHHLFSIKDINESYSVEEYQSLVRKKIQEIFSKNKTPILVGGTGLYIKAALYDYDFTKQDKDKVEEIELKYKDYTNEQLYKKLLEIDPKSCENIHQNNRRRVLRAIAIYETTGISKSEHIKKQNHQIILPCKLIGLYMDKEELDTRINKRVDIMFDEGAVEEVKRLNASITAAKAIGFPEISDYLNNKITLEDCKELIKLHTRQYSKRQMTWLKHQFDLKWFKIGNNCVEEIYNYLMEE